LKPFTYNFIISHTHQLVRMTDNKVVCISKAHGDDICKIWNLFFTTQYEINLYILLVYYSFLTCWIFVGKLESKTPLAGVEVRITLKLVHSCYRAS